MHIRTAQKILDDENSLNIELLAQAHTEKQKQEAKNDRRLPTKQRSMAAWIRLKTRRQNEEAWRQTVREVWDKNMP